MKEDLKQTITTPEKRRRHRHTRQDHINHLNHHHALRVNTQTHTLLMTRTSHISQIFCYYLVYKLVELFRSAGE